MNFKEKYLTYSKTKGPEEDSVVFSPSAFSNFITHPWRWYREQVQGIDKFEGNTASAIGTIIHAVAACVALGEEVDKEAIHKYIYEKEPSEDYNPDTVSAAYQEMAEALVNEYVLQNGFMEVETSHITPIEGNYYASGTIDRLEGSKQDTLLVDYKTYNNKTKPKTIPSYYKHQLLMYAYILKNSGYHVTRIRLVYVNRPVVGEISPKTGKQFKSYPSEVTVLTEVLTEEDLSFIESMIELCVDSLEATKKHPELARVIWHDLRIV